MKKKQVESVKPWTHTHLHKGINEMIDEEWNIYIISPTKCVLVTEGIMGKTEGNIFSNEGNWICPPSNVQENNSPSLL